MSPEYGATCGFFPVDDETLRYLRLTGRSEDQVALVEAYCKENGLWHDPEEQPTYSQVVELDLSTVEPSIAGPRRPQDRIPLRERATPSRQRSRRSGSHEGNGRSTRPTRSRWTRAIAPALTATAERTAVELTIDGETVEIDHGAVVIAAITSCTNTSNPAVMIGAGLLAKKAVERGLTRKPWVKTSLAPGSKVVTEYYEKAGLTTVPRGARLQHRRLRLHDLHRELGPAAGGGLAGGRRTATSSPAPCSPATATSRPASIPR